MGGRGRSSAHQALAVRLSGGANDLISPSIREWHMKKRAFIQKYIPDPPSMCCCLFHCCVLVFAGHYSHIDPGLHPRTHYTYAIQAA